MTCRRFEKGGLIYGDGRAPARITPSGTAESQCDERPMRGHGSHSCNGEPLRERLGSKSRPCLIADFEPPICVARRHVGYRIVTRQQMFGLSLCAYAPKRYHFKWTAPSMLQFGTAEE